MGVLSKEDHGNQGAAPAQDPRHSLDASVFVPSVTRAKDLHPPSLLLG